MRTLAIGDIHGCLAAFEALLEAVAPTSDDLIVTLGDYVDRGPDSYGVIERLIALSQTHRLVPLRGNHEEMMINARETGEHMLNWLWCGGRETLKSYSPLADEGKIVDVPESHWGFFQTTCRDFFETDTHIFVHANLYPDYPLSVQPGYMLRWEKLEKPVRHMSGKVMVCGHTRQRDGRPLYSEHTICIDTGAYSSGWLTALDTTSGRFWQANQIGDTRTGWIDECPSERPGWKL